ncbi:hypothetical protein [Psittacicella gerlachiana]|uniref:Uncharacterized protein n=1 Tax=Psittacicella gerlachiana TaxID=2028574 RepID=A0A3A1YAP3_9GAMM|nr:hypothetical protein [Psittacicella gerlachiana]RIY34280.1 hypothetical protein CKF59_05720 [Psittacicella gerlachiana]
MLYIVFIGVTVFVVIGHKLFTFNHQQYVEKQDLPCPELAQEHDYLLARLHGDGKTSDAYVGAELPQYQEPTDIKYLHPNSERLLVCLQSGRRYRLPWLEISRIYYLQERKSPFFHLVITTKEGDRFVCKNLSRLDIQDFVQNLEIFIVKVKDKMRDFAFVSKNCQFKAQRTISYYQEIIILKTKLQAELATKKVPADFLIQNSNVTFEDIKYKPHLRS